MKKVIKIIKKIFLITFIISLLIIFLCALNYKAVGGSVTNAGSYIDNGKYYLLTTDGILKEIDKQTWMVNLYLSHITIIASIYVCIYCSIAIPIVTIKRIRKKINSDNM